MAKWFVLEAVDVRGPLSPTELLDLVRRGTVTPETKVRKDDSAWFPAGDVGGLFAAAVKPTIVFRCPSCQAVVPKEHGVCSQCGSEVHGVYREVIQNRIDSQPDKISSSKVAASMQSWLNKVRRKT